FDVHVSKAPPQVQAEPGTADRPCDDRPNSEIEQRPAHNGHNPVFFNCSLRARFSACPNRADEVRCFALTGTGTPTKILQSDRPADTDATPDPVPSSEQRNGH